MKLVLFALDESMMGLVSKIVPYVRLMPLLIYRI